MILTHIDDDHIGGILRWFNQDPDAAGMVKKIWFNGGREISEYLNETPNEDLDLMLEGPEQMETSHQQGIDFAKHLQANGAWDGNIIVQGQEVSQFGFVFKFLSPNKDKLTRLVKEWKKEKPDYFTSRQENDYCLSITDHIAADKFEEDKALANGSSIAFLLEIGEFCFAFLGDAHPSVLITGLRIWHITPENPIKTKLVKLSHHGSKGNTSYKLLQCFIAEAYLLSTNGQRHEHPDKQMLSRLINVHGDCTIYFNYPERITEIFSQVDREQFARFEAQPMPNPLIYQI
jgi:hypothetical protein